MTGKRERFAWFGFGLPLAEVLLTGSIIFGVPLAAATTLLAKTPEVANAPRPSFLESIYCAVCHANSSRAEAMRDANGHGIAPYDLWRSSAMANSTRDPFWRAVLSAEIAATPSRKELIEEKCTRCHAPMAAPAPLSPDGQILSHISSDDERSKLGHDGVSCTVCHQVRNESLGEEASFTGHFRIGEKGPIFGPHADPFPMPMMRHTGYTPTHSKHVLRAALCATCHELDTEALQPDGSKTGHRLHEQSPYREWRNSVFNDELARPHADAQSCQACHLPTTGDDGNATQTRIAHNPGGRDFPFLRDRSPFGRHTFFGGNTFLAKLLRDNHASLNVEAPTTNLDARIQSASAALGRLAGKVEVGKIHFRNGRLVIPVHVHNLAGHKLPTAYPSRRVWLRVEVCDSAGETVFASGRFDTEGRLVRRAADEDLPLTQSLSPAIPAARGMGEGTAESADRLNTLDRPLESESPGGAILPHFQVVSSSDEVQVYQSVMANSEGQPTFTLLRGARYLKDNRLLPRGWDSSFHDAESTAPVGTSSDKDFKGGHDRVNYEVAVDANGTYRITATLHYQAISPRHVAELFQVDTPQVQTFRTLYEKADRTPETLATAHKTWSGTGP